MAGHVISTYLKEQGHKVSAYTRKKNGFDININGDLTNFNDLTALEKIIITEKFDAIVNAVGILNESADAQKDAAVLLNSYLPHFLSELTKSMNTKIIHMSTDCVFSGEKGSYKESDFKDGETFYDRTKALGEINNEKDITFRNSIIGPDISLKGIGLFNWFMKQNGKIDGYSKAVWNGVTTITLAKAIDKVLNENLTGIYHLVNDAPINKADLLRLFNKHFKNNEIEISDNETVSINKSLVNTRKDFTFNVGDYEMMIVEMKEWIQNHKDLYPHYFTDGGLK